MRLHRLDRTSSCDRYGLSFLQQGEHRWCAAGKQHVGFEVDKFLGDEPHPVGFARWPAVVGAKTAAFDPSQFLEALTESREPNASLGIGVGITAAHHGGKVPYALALLRKCRERPRGRRAAEQRDKFAPPDHSITSSARASSVAGTSRPSILAVLTLMTNSYLVGACTGRSAGFSPLRMRST